MVVLVGLLALPFVVVFFATAEASLGVVLPFPSVRVLHSKPNWLLHAIEIAAQKGWTMLWLEADSQYVVSLINSKATTLPWNLRSRGLYVIHLLNSMTVRATHIYREGNQSADALSKCSDGCSWWSSAPQFIADLIAQDMSGRPFSRLCT